jgi:Fic family protein
MSFIEKKSKEDLEYFSFVKKVSFMGKRLVIKEYLGKSITNTTKEKYLLDNLDSISEKEFKFRYTFLNKIKDELSHNLSLPEEIEKKTIRIDNLTEGKKCSELLDSEFATEFIFNSNNIEGSKIPPDKVRQIIETGDTSYKDKNEIKEVENSIIAFKYLKNSFKFNLNSVKRLYHLLTNDLYMENKLLYPKGFKKISNIVGNSITTSPEKVKEELYNLLKWYKNNKNKIHPIILAFEFHRRYEHIHPFLDGNGRTGRLIMNKILMSNGYSPIIVYKDNKLAYFNSLSKSEEGNLKNYYQFMFEQTNKTYDFLLDVIKRY